MKILQFQRLSAQNVADIQKARTAADRARQDVRALEKEIAARYGVVEEKGQHLAVIGDAVLVTDIWVPFL